MYASLRSVRRPLRAARRSRPSASRSSRDCPVVASMIARPDRPARRQHARAVRLEVDLKPTEVVVRLAERLHARQPLALQLEEVLPVRALVRERHVVLARRRHEPRDGRRRLHVRLGRQPLLGRKLFLAVVGGVLLRSRERRDRDRKRRGSTNARVDMRRNERGMDTPRMGARTCAGGRRRDWQSYARGPKNAVTRRRYLSRRRIPGSAPHRPSPPVGEPPPARNPARVAADRHLEPPRGDRCPRCDFTLTQSAFSLL